MIDIKLFAIEATRIIKGHNPGTVKNNAMFWFEQGVIIVKDIHKQKWHNNQIEYVFTIEGRNRIGKKILSTPSKEKGALFLVYIYE